MARRPSLPGLFSSLRSRPPRVATDQIYRSGGGASGSPPGGVGPAGRDAGFKYTYLTDTNNTDPGTGKLKFNSTTFASITTLRISETDGDGNSLFNFLATVDDPTSSIKGHIVMRKIGAPATFAVFSITGALTDNGTWDSLAIALVVSAGSFANNDGVILNFYRTGDQGPQGIQGDAGATGASGASGSGWLTPCRAATTGNITISTALNNGDVLDGVTLATNDRVLVKDQTTASENGIYVVGTSPARATDADATGEIVGGTTVRVQEGTANADTEWTVTTDGTITIGTTGIAWERRPISHGSYFTHPAVGASASSTGLANLQYDAMVVVTARALLTGIGYWVGSTAAGNVRSALYNAAGTKIADKTSNVAQAAANSFQPVPFDSTLWVPAGVYFGSIIFSSASATGFTGKGMLPSKFTTEAGFTTASSLTVPTVPNSTGMLILTTY